MNLTICKNKDTGLCSIRNNDTNLYWTGPVTDTWVKESDEIWETPNHKLAVSHKNGLLLLEASNNKKTCRIVNDRFTWVLYVDNQTIPFQLASNADYFAKHYEALGYEIIQENRNERVM